MARRSKVKYTKRVSGVRGPQIKTYSVNLNRAQNAWWVRRARALKVSKALVAQRLFDAAMASDLTPGPSPEGEGSTR